MSDFALAAVLGGAILVASTISIEIGLSVALIELAAGVFVGNAFHPELPDWLSFIGSFAGIVLTFLAGAEVDVSQFKREWRASVSIGTVSFFAPFLVAGTFAYVALGWTLKQSEIAGIALSTTSCRAMSVQVAPSARRMESSRARLAARRSSRLPTFTQAMRRSSATAADSTTSTGRTSPTIASASVRT